MHWLNLEHVTQDLRPLKEETSTARHTDNARGHLPSAAAAAAEGAQYGKSTGLGAPQPASAAQLASLRAVEEDSAAKYRG
jgi:hypothetical protein